MPRSLSTQDFYRFFAAQCYATIRSGSSISAWWKGRASCQRSRPPIAGSSLRDPKIYFQEDFLNTTRVISRGATLRIARELGVIFSRPACADPSACGFVVPFEHVLAPQQVRCLSLLRKILQPFVQKSRSDALRYEGACMARIRAADTSPLRCSATHAAPGGGSPLYLLRVTVRYFAGSFADSLAGGATVSAGTCGLSRWVDCGGGRATFSVPLRRRYARWICAGLQSAFVSDRVSSFAARAAFARNIFSVRSRGPAPSSDAFDLRGYSDELFRSLRAERRVLRGGVRGMATQTPVQVQRVECINLAPAGGPLEGSTV